MHLLISNYFSSIEAMLYTWGLSEASMPVLSTLIVGLSAAALCAMLYLLLAHPVAKCLNEYIDKTETKTDDILLSPAVVRSLCRLAVAVMILYIAPHLCLHYPDSVVIVSRTARILVIFAVTNTLLLEINGFCLYLRSAGKRAGVLVLRNVLQTIVIAIAALLAVSTMLGRELAYVISALGAMAAVLMLVFKDSILGMIAGIRLTLNGMLKENDWITVPSFNADGRVEDVSLTSVKIRNWDKSISTVPPHALISGGFVNHESMLSLGLRQIRRAIYLDTATVRHLDTSELRALKEASPFPGADDTSVNISLFRRYVRHLLATHPSRAEKGNGHKLQLMVRELPATQDGIPLEIFFFVNCTDWEQFEELQADLLDRIMAEAPRFSLRIYQHPSGADILAAPALRPATSPL